MSLDNSLGPPPALYATLLGIPLPDCLISVNGSAPLACNEDRLRNASPFFATLLSEHEFQESRFLQLQLTSSNAELTFSKVMSFLNTGDFDMTGCTSEQMLAVANECQILSLQERTRETFSTPLPKPVSHYPSVATVPPLPCPVPIFSPVPNPFLFMDLQTQLHAANLLQMMMTQMHNVNPPQELLDDKPFKKRRDVREMKKAHSLDSDEPPYDNLGDVIIPSTDKEGWCRNKKYIEKTDGGFMCMVCKKVYGRYNSVSYHVTIYHRNPPIKCDLPGCQFTTREARYIHFHKYYRHGIALPDSIDQGSRRCPHCRHVSKSPAMLDKHIRRHQNLEARDGNADIDSTSMDFVVVDDEMAQEERARGVSLSMEVSVSEAPVEDSATKPRAFTL
ncbi:BTB domain-containing protein [Trichostrongylus colubriformis]|uniref:BTB domain-containing protein n=1 Tax=Trichostrongylus colubriformis TaxID=6319 RepID=A0AAN8FYZ6_TRICO